MLEVVEQEPIPCVRCGHVKMALEGQTMTCPKNPKHTHTFPYQPVFVEKKVENYQHRQRSHKRGWVRGAHKNQK